MSNASLSRKDFIGKGLTEAGRYDGFSQEDVWHEMRVLGCDERQAIRSLNEAHARLDD